MQTLVIVSGLLLLAAAWGAAFWNIASATGEDRAQYALAGFLLGPLAIPLLLGIRRKQARRQLPPA